MDNRHIYMYLHVEMSLSVCDEHHGISIRLCVGGAEPGWTVCVGVWRCVLMYMSIVYIGHKIWTCMCVNICCVNVQSRYMGVWVYGCVREFKFKIRMRDEMRLPEIDVICRYKNI